MVLVLISRISWTKAFSFNSRSSTPLLRTKNFHIATTQRISQRPFSLQKIFSLQSGDTAEKIDYTSTRYIADNATDAFYDDAERDASCLVYPKGTPEGFYVVKQYEIPEKGFSSFSSDVESVGISQEEVTRLDIDSKNITLPIALMLLDNEEYPSLSRARKACRKGYIVIHRGALERNATTGMPIFETSKCLRGRVGDRVFPGDVIGRQVRMHGGFYPGFNNQKPAFDLPVVYEDDHFAIVNKPAGVVVYSQRKQNHGLMTVRAALPFVLKPPTRGTLAIIRRPASVHRLDKPTSGLLLVAKTKPAMVHLTRQFTNRIIKKTYTAIVNGIPSEKLSSNISNENARNLGFDVNADESVEWQLIDNVMDEKQSVTIWRPIKSVKSLKANDGALTLVELKPKTGRYHQLRRHMAWEKDCPIIGDKTYDGGGEAIKFRERGLFLCSNKVILEHPYYNSEHGKREWENLPLEKKEGEGYKLLENDGTIFVEASIDLPQKFHSFLDNEEKRYKKFEWEVEN